MSIKNSNRKKVYQLTYDKYVPNRFGGCDIERSVVSATSKELAVRVMKNDLYNHGCFGALGAVRYKNGKTEHIRPRKAPTITWQECGNCSVKRETKKPSLFGIFGDRNIKR